MKILMIGAGYPPGARGGTEVHMRQLATALVSEGHDVRVFCRRGEASDPEYAGLEESHERVSIVRINNTFRNTRTLDAIYSDKEIDKALLAELKSHPPDVVHVHHLTCLSTTLLEVVKEHDIPLVMTLHDFWMVCARGQRITPELEICTTLDRDRCAPCLNKLWPHFDITANHLRMIDKELRQRLLLCDRLLTPSEHHRVKMLEFGLDPARIVALPHGIDETAIAEIPRRVFPPRRIGFLGSVIPTKGVHLLVEAMNRIGNPNLECHIHGEAPGFHGDTGYLDRLKSLARKDLPFHFHGSYEQADLPRILASVDLIVVPSLWWESFCLTIREAMTAGIPVIASDLGAMHEALTDAEPGLLFRAGDPDDLAHKIHHLCSDAAHYGRASELRSRVRTLKSMTEATLLVYSGLVDQHRSRNAEKKKVKERKLLGKDRPYATVFVPTWNGGKLFEQVLEKILTQKTDFRFETLIIDSGSKDGTLEFVRSKPGVRLIEIPNTEFNHGLTRNRAVKEAQGEIVILLTHDAVPLDENWLQTLVDNFDDSTVAGVYCHQLPREDCNPFQRDRLRGWTRGEGTPKRKQLIDRALWESMHPYDRYLLIAFDDVASSVRKSVMEAIPFEKRQFGEDVAWGRAAILAGHVLVMDPRSVVVHSHNKPIFYEFKRVYLDHQNLSDLVGLQTVPTFWLVLKFSVKATFHLSKVVLKDDRSLGYRLLWLLKTPYYAFTQNLAQYLGARSTLRGRRGLMGKIDRWLRRGV